MEGNLILTALRENKWNRRKAALALNISYRALIYKIPRSGPFPQSQPQEPPEELPRDRATGWIEGYNQLSAFRCSPKQ